MSADERFRRALVRAMRDYLRETGQTPDLPTALLLELHAAAYRAESWVVGPWVRDGTGYTRTYSRPAAMTGEEGE